MDCLMRLNDAPIPSFPGPHTLLVEMEQDLLPILVVHVVAGGHLCEGRHDPRRDVAVAIQHEHGVLILQLVLTKSFSTQIG